MALVTQNPVCVGNSAFRIGNVGRYVDTVPFGAFRREIFDRIGLFREDLERHQDFELNARVRKAGGRIYLSSRIHCTYYNAPSFSKFMRQAYMNGIYMGRAWQRYPVSFCWRHAAPVTFVCGMLLLALLGQFIPAFMWVLAAAAAVYILAITAAGLLIARRHGLRYLCLAPVLICSYHLVYGGSTCVGLLNEPFVRWWPFAATSKTRVTDCVQDSESSSS